MAESLGTLFYLHSGWFLLCKTTVPYARRAMHVTLESAFSTFHGSREGEEKANGRYL